MDVLDRLASSGIVPVVAIEDVKDAVTTAKALLAGGVDVMEITFRTSAAEDCIKEVIRACPDMCVGAGTVISLAQAQKAVELGCKFIVSPGYDEEIVKYCNEAGIAVTPGCVTPSEIMAALKQGIHVLKFFPAGVYGGLKAIRALAGPFGNKVKFIPTGGVNAENLAEYAASSSVHAIGGTWVCSKKDISDGNFDKITKLCKEAKDIIAEARS